MTLHKFECWYDELDEDDTTVVYARSAGEAAERFTEQTHDGSERSEVVIREDDGVVSAWSVTSKVEWSHKARPAKP